jgi:cytosine/adenosine deaminase-related metal-dependent hydrolase
MNEAYAQKLRDDIAQNKIDLLLVHVAEGSPQDMESSLEFRALKGEGLLGERTSIIHGVALQSDEFKQMWKSHMALVWSPRSNMELYGVTTNIAAALVMWLLGFSLNIAGGLIHLLLVIALVVLIINLVSGRRAQNL